MFAHTLHRIPVIAMVVLAVVTLWSTPASVAAPVGSAIAPSFAAQNVDWMSSGDAASLDLGFSVLVPTWIPAPFGGSPAIQGGGGYYSLYWMNTGGAPTFLQITGEVGGALPAGSPADLNNQLSINASVQGYDAIHDVTSIYDNVWWIAGGVLYTVSSNNMTGTDSLSLANSLVELVPPAEPEPEPTPTPEPSTTDPGPEPSTGEETEDGSGPTGSIDNNGSVSAGDVATLWVYPSATGTLRATDGYFAASGATFITGLTGGAVDWVAPSVDSQVVVEFTLLDADTGVVTGWSSITVYPGDSESSATETATSTETATATEASTEEATSEATAANGDGSGGTGATATATEEAEAVQTPAAPAAGGAPLSDGTGGPQLPRGGDGTGGIRQIVIP